MRIPKRPVRYYTAKLPTCEHNLLRDLRTLGGTEDRYTALQQLVPFMEALTEEDFPVEVMDPIRLAIPTELDEATKRKVKELDRPYIRLIVEAAKKWLANRQAAN